MTDQTALTYPISVRAMARGVMESAIAFGDQADDAFLAANASKIIALAQSLSAAAVQRRNIISSWSALIDYLKARTLGMGREEMRVIFLDKKNRMIADECMWSGTVDHAPVYPREIARRALELDASSLILTHNHPSGDPAPSAADIDMTRQIVTVLPALRISVHDHVITAHGTHASFKALGLI